MLCHTIDHFSKPLKIVVLFLLLLYVSYFKWYFAKIRSALAFCWLKIANVCWKFLKIQKFSVFTCKIVELLKSRSIAKSEGKIVNGAHFQANEKCSETYLLCVYYSGVHDVYDVNTFSAGIYTLTIERMCVLTILRACKCKLDTSTLFFTI